MAPVPPTSRDVRANPQAASARKKLGITKSYAMFYKKLLTFGHLIPWSAQNGRIRSEMSVRPPVQPPD